MAASLLDYQFGDLLGRGASGNVYRAINFRTGETVAIKSISVQSLPASSLPDIQSEIDLLKKLNHPNVVKYKGSAQDKDNLFIILEYCENGSLQTILKKFGKFPESLVAVYISQVLEGLAYLHEQGVIHRDIKGANILTNKDGSVKLADFGVSSRAPTPDIADVANTDAADNEVVGSPYWMAPEVIEQSGATTTSDIWSVGCVVVELLEGKPPYGDLAPMQALWRIVQDESMRIPEGASPVVKDFLYQCFQKDPNLRVTAKKLLRHAWMQTARRSPGEHPGHTTPKAKNNHSRTGNHHAMRGSIPAVMAPSEEASPRRDATVVLSKQKITHGEAIQQVQQWNEALNASPKNFSTMRRTPRSKANEAPRNRSDSVLAPGPAVAPALAPPGAGGLLQKNQHVSEVLNRARENSETEWDNDFADIAFDERFAKVTPRKAETSATASSDADLEGHDSDTETLRAKAVTRTKPSASSARMTGIVEDYSDLAAGEDDLAAKLSDMKLRDKGRIRLMRPSDLQKIGTLQPQPREHREREAPKPPPKPSPPSMGPPPVPPKSTPAPSPAPQAVSTSSPTASIRTPPGSRNSSLRGRKAAPENLELQKYTEDDEEDYSDIGHGFEADGAYAMGSLQLTRRSNRSWKEQEQEEDEEDPFAEFDDFDVDDLEANLHHNKKAALWGQVEKIVDQMQVGTAHTTLRVVCDELLNMLETAPPDMGLERHFVQVHGMLTVLELLESRMNRDVAVRLLKIVNFIVAFDVDNLESFCLVGGIPVIIPYTSKKHSVETRLEASTFIQHLTRSALTLQMFISCRGLKVLVELLDEDYSNQKALILSALEGIGSVFDLQSPTPKPDFCRMFTREGILDPLATSLLAVIQDPEVVDDTPKRALEVLLLFCQVAQSDDHVRQGFATRTIMMRLLRILKHLPDTSLVTAIKAIKHLATHPKLIEVLQNSNAMEDLVELLGKLLNRSEPPNEICSHIFQAIYSMCRLSKARQEEAASAGIIPMLKKTIDRDRPFKQFVFPILCDLANAGKAARRLLWQNDGMNLYLNLLDDPYWRTSALEAVVTWMTDEPARVEDVLLMKEPTDSLRKCFVYAAPMSFERILESYLKLFRLSSALTTAVSTSTQFLRRLSEALERQESAAGVRLSLLHITRVVFEHHPDREAMITRYRIDDIVDKLSKQDSAVLVRELAKKTYTSLVFGGQEPAAPTSSQAAVSVLAQSTVPAKRVFSVRRTSGDSRAPGSRIRPKDQKDRDRERSRDRGNDTHTSGASYNGTNSHDMFLSPTEIQTNATSTSSSRSVTPTQSKKRPLSRQNLTHEWGHRHGKTDTDGRDVQWAGDRTERTDRTSGSERDRQSLKSVRQGNRRSQSLFQSQSQSQGLSLSQSQSHGRSQSQHQMQLPPSPSPSPRSHAGHARQAAQLGLGARDLGR